MLVRQMALEWGRGIRCPRTLGPTVTGVRRGMPATGGGAGQKGE